jgi:hypothetical protein
MLTILWIALAILVIVIAIAINSIRAGKRRSAHPDLDRELFRQNREHKKRGW